MEEISNLVTNFGFPIVLSFYLLMRTEQKLNDLTEVIQNLTNVITKCEKN